MPLRLPRNALALLIQLLLSVGVVSVGVFLKLPPLLLLAFALLLAQTVLIGLANRGRPIDLLLGWGATLLACGSVCNGDAWRFVHDFYVPALVGSLSIALLITGWNLPDDRFRVHWRRLSMIWTLLSSAMWMVCAYIENSLLHFYWGVLFNLIVLILCKRLLRLPDLVIQGVNTLIVFLIGLPLADLAVRPSYRLDQRPDPHQRLFSYREARKNPAAFGHWWYHFLREFHETRKSICMPDTNGWGPFRLRPSSDGQLFESRIHINQLGFRGPEIPFAKGDAYRIVALGESTTFGITLFETDTPWPRLLEKLIVDELHPSRPIQVINAGITAYNLRMNLQRMNADILPLKPDLIVSYHGYNGFEWLLPTLPPVSGESPPEYRSRPLKLLADCEYRLKVLLYRRHQTAVAPPPTPLSALTENEYVRGYNELINLAHTNGIRLALANYSMAVKDQSDLDVVAFYRSGFPNVLSQIRANELHSQIVASLTRQHPEVIFVDTHPRLDGLYENYIDLVHFTQPGRNEMAHIMFEALKPILQKDLSPHRDLTKPNN